MESMHTSDVTVLDAAVEHTSIGLEWPFKISGRVIDWFTLAEVTVRVRTRGGVEARGKGATILSVPWAWPHSELEVEARDEVLRTLTERYAASAVGRHHCDPIRLWRMQYDSLEAATVAGTGDVTVPRLAMLLALGATDSAVHDAWAQAAGQPAHLLYDADHLDEDLAFLGDPRLAGCYPGHFLSVPRTDVPIQHVVGAGDPLTPAEAADGELSLREWLRRDRPRYLKIKTAAEDPAADAKRVAEVAAVALEVGIDVSLTVDPNEGYRSAREVADFIDRLDDLSVRAELLEQPCPRGEVVPGMAGLSARLPVLLDEGFTNVAELPELTQQGWSGIVIKAGKGQTPALLAYSFARATGLAVSVQDLTTVGLAFLHSARLVSLFELSSPHLEYNSRQYAPSGNARLGEQYPDLVQVHDGTVKVPTHHPGLY